MTLNEIIEEIETHTYSSSPIYGIDDDIANYIIALLKSAETMRSNLKGYSCDCPSYKDLDKARLIWDDITEVKYV